MKNSAYDSIGNLLTKSDVGNSRRNHQIAATIDETTSVHSRLARIMKYTSRRGSEAPPRILQIVRGNLFVAFADLMRRCPRKKIVDAAHDTTAARAVRA